MNYHVKKYANRVSNNLKPVGVVVAIAFVLEKLFYIICCSIILHMIFKVFKKIINMF